MNNLSTFDKNTTCMDCTKRFPGCHGSCEDYISWKKEHEAKKNMLIESRYKDLSGWPKRKRRKV